MQNHGKTINKNGNYILLYSNSKSLKKIIDTFIFPQRYENFSIIVIIFIHSNL